MFVSFADPGHPGTGSGGEASSQLATTGDAPPGIGNWQLTHLLPPVGLVG
jgi:hypothetical protein